MSIPVAITLVLLFLAIIAALIVIFGSGGSAGLLILGSIGMFIKSCVGFLALSIL